LGLRRAIAFDPSEPSLDSSSLFELSSWLSSFCLGLLFEPTLEPSPPLLDASLSLPEDELPLLEDESSLSSPEDDEDDMDL